MQIKFLIKNDFEVADPYSEISLFTKRLLEKSYLVVMDKSEFLGILTPADIAGSPQLVIDSLQDKPHVDSDQEIHLVLELMRESQNPVLPVFKETEFIGVITQVDITNFLIEYHNKLEREVSQRTTELDKINECLLSFVPEPLDNINSLTKLCGELLGATCALYNRLDQGMLYSWGQWNTPPDYNPVDRPDGHICYDVIKKAGDQVLVISNLLETPYAQTDPNVIPYGLQTYIGRAVKFGNNYVGSLCAVFQDDYVPSEGDERLMGIIASAIGVEEERKQAEDALKRAHDELEKRVEELYRGMVESSPDAIVSVNEKREIIEWNEAAARVFGYSWEEAHGRLIDILVPEKYGKRHVRGFERFLRTGESRLIGKTVELEGLRKDGTVAPVELSLSAAKRGESRVFTGIMRDITARKRAEEALRESEERYRDLFESAPNAYFSISAVDGSILRCNSAALRLLGYDKETMLRMKASDLYADTPGGKAKAQEVFNRFRNGGSIRDAVLEMKHKDGHSVWVSLSVEPVRDVEGKVIESRSIVVDITERKLAEEQLLEYQNKLRSMASEISLVEERERRRIATELHDRIGQTLYVSKIRVSMLKESVSSTDLTESLEEIEHLIGQTMKDVRSLTFELSPPVLYELGFEAAVEWLLEEVHKQQGLAFEFNSDGHLRPLSTSLRVLLFQSVRELLLNVVKHAKTRSVNISIRTGDDQIEIYVQDDGIGFDASSIEPRGYRSGGFGLFSIIERLEAIGGHVKIESEPGCGTKVALLAPLRYDEERA